MNETNHHSSRNVSTSRKTLSNVLLVLVIIVAVGIAVGAILWFSLSGSNENGPGSTSLPNRGYPVGVTSSSEPSGKGPPIAGSLPGYKLDYETDFPGTSLPSGWYVFTGVPGGDPGGQFGSAHVVVSNGLLLLNTFQDPSYGYKWVTGGLCQCGLAHTYGATFVRSRVTGPGPNEAELLWPKASVWPPEIDFNETGGEMNSTSSTVHFGATNLIDQRHVDVNMKKWHTWGVVWTPTSISYIVDGRVWGKVTSEFEIPNQPMTVDFEQRALCAIGRQCPTAPVSLQIDWVAEYAPK